MILPRAIRSGLASLLAVVSLAAASRRHDPLTEKEVDEILAPLPPPDAFPSFLPLEQQGLFVLGYHHQRHELFLSREERARRAAADNESKETAQ